jgi:hypothetical protein
MATQITHKAIVRNWLFLLLFLVLNGAAVSLSAQDTRNVTEPIFPATCIVVQAPLRSTADGPNVGGTAEEQDAESSAETTVIQEALDHCAPYKAVELALGSDRLQCLPGQSS